MLCGWKHNTKSPRRYLKMAGLGVVCSGYDNRQPIGNYALNPKIRLLFMRQTLCYHAMRNLSLAALAISALVAWTATAGAQSLPAVTLKPVFEKLSDERPVWMSEGPDGSGRLFIVYQKGKIAVVKKGSDGGTRRPFWILRIAIRILKMR